MNTTINADLNRNLIERVAIGDLLRRKAREAGQREAIVSYNNSQRIALSYYELNKQVNQLVRGLRSRGLKQGDRLALLASNCPEFFIVSFACYKAGIVLVPINVMQNVDDIAYNFEHAEVKAVVFEQQFETLALSASDGNTSIHSRIIISDNSAVTDQSIADDNLRSLISQQDSSEIEDIVIQDRDTAQLLYTSGTTSRPKGVKTSHLSLYLASLTSALNLSFGRNHRHYVVLPVFHCAALSMCLSTLQTSGTVVLQQSFDPAVVNIVLDSERIQSAVLLPVMWKALLQAPDSKKCGFSHFETGIYAMAPMDSDALGKLRKHFNAEFHLASGQSEFTPAACFYYDGSDSEFGEGNYWGVPSFIADQAILDDKGNEVPQGTEGEICWRGPQVMSGYLNNQEATDEVSQFGWHHSGDLGLIDSKGQLLFVDRKKDMIKSGGENVPSCKVEQVLLSIEGILQTGAFGVPHPHWSEAVCACVQLAPGSSLNEAEIIAECKKHLGGFQVPKRIFLVDSFPTTGTGKILKRELRETYKDLFTEETA